MPAAPRCASEAAARRGCAPLFFQRVDLRQLCRRSAHHVGASLGSGRVRARGRARARARMRALDARAPRHAASCADAAAPASPPAQLQGAHRGAHARAQQQQGRAVVREGRHLRGLLGGARRRDGDGNAHAAARCAQARRDGGPPRRVHAWGVRVLRARCLARAGARRSRSCVVSEPKPTFAPADAPAARRAERASCPFAMEDAPPPAPRSSESRCVARAGGPAKFPVSSPKNSQR